MGILECLIWAEIFKTVAGGGGSGGTTNYNDLSNKPKINNITLSGSKTLAALGIAAAGDLSTLQSTVEGLSALITQIEGEIPDAYVKGASVSGNTLTLTLQNGTTVTYTPQGGGEPDAYIKSIQLISNGDGIKYTDKAGTATNFTPKATDKKTVVLTSGTQTVSITKGDTLIHAMGANDLEGVNGTLAVNVGAMSVPFTIRVIATVAAGGTFALTVGGDYYFIIAWANGETPTFEAGKTYEILLTDSADVLGPYGYKYLLGSYTEYTLINLPTE